MKRTLPALLALIPLLAMPCLAEPPAPAATPATTPAATPEAKPTPRPRKAEDAYNISGYGNPKRHAEFMARIQQGPVGLLFLGDSILDLWPRTGELTWLKFAPFQPANFGSSGEHTNGLLWRVKNGELDGISPKVVVVLIGSNNLGSYKDEKPEWTATGVEKIVGVVREKLPQSRVLLLGVLPRYAKASEIRGRIAETNAILSRLDDGQHVRFLDIGPKFLDAEGNIPPELMPDGLHPSAKGYVIFFDAMWPLLEEMLR